MVLINLNIVVTITFSFYISTYLLKKKNNFLNHAIILHTFILTKKYFLTLNYF